jgi:hypothetical protein
MRIACWAPKATNTHSEYVIPTAFSRQQWLQQRATMYSTLAVLLISGMGLFNCTVARKAHQTFIVLSRTCKEA